MRNEKCGIRNGQSFAEVRNRFFSILLCALRVLCVSQLVLGAQLTNLTLDIEKVKIGITGGIGSGKSYICNLLRERGYEVYNCDDEAKRLMLEDVEIISQIKTLIGNDAYTSYGQLNKPVIAKFIFSDKGNTAKMNSIVHPAVKKDFLRWAEDKHVAIMECAILFESGFDDVVDTTVLIWADARNRLKRAMVRDHATKEQIEARMAVQISDEEAKRRADYIFRHNNYDETENEMRKLIQYIEKYS